MAVDQMSILTNGFSAEHGASTGSVINIVTRSGGDASTDNSSSSGAPRRPRRSSQASPAPTRQRQRGHQRRPRTNGGLALRRSWRIPRSALFHRCRVQPRSQGLAHHLAARPRQLRRTLPWLARARSPRSPDQRKNNIFLRANMDSFTDTNPNGIVGGSSLATVARVFHRRTYTGELGDTAILGAGLVNNPRLQFQLASPITEFDPVIYGTQFVVPVSSGGTFTSGTSQSALLMNQQYEFSDTVAATWAGISSSPAPASSMRTMEATAKSSAAPSSSENSPTTPALRLPASARAGVSQQHRQRCQLSAELRQRQLHRRRPALGTLRTGRLPHLPRLTLNGGLRYERQTLTDAKLNFAPRVGFVFDTRGNG